MVSSVLLCSMCSQPSFATDFTPPDNRDTWFIAFVATVYSVSEIREQPLQPVKWDEHFFGGAGNSFLRKKIPRFTSSCPKQGFGSRTVQSQKNY